MSEPVARAHQLAVGSVLLGVFASVLNARLTGLTLADVQGALGASRDETAWVNTAYAVGEVVVIPWAVWLASALSVRRVIVPAALAFAVSCLLAAGAQTIEQLVLARALQGLTGGALVPMATPVFRRKLPLHPRVLAFGLYGIVATTPFAVAPMLSAVFTERAEWRLVFLVPAALSALVAVVAARCMVSVPVDRAALRTLDWPGLSLLSAGFACLVLAVDQADRLDWLDSRWVLGLGAAALALLLATAVHVQGRADKVLTLDILTRWNLHLALATFLVVRLSLLVVGVVLPDFLARTHGLRPFDFCVAWSALLLPQVLVPLVVVRRARRSSDPRVLLALAVACQALAVLLGVQLTADWKTAELLPVLVLHGVGQGLFFVPLLLLLTQDLDAHHRPTAMVLTNLTRAAGNAAGAALLGALLRRREALHLEALAEHVTTASPLVGLARLARRQASVLAYADVFLVVGALLLGCVLLHGLLRRVDLRELEPNAGPNEEVT